MTTRHDECDCIKKLRGALEEHHQTAVDFELSHWLVIETGQVKAGLPPLKYSYMDGKKRKKSHFKFPFCGLCGKERL